MPTSVETSFSDLMEKIETPVNASLESSQNLIEGVSVSKASKHPSSVSDILKFAKRSSVKQRPWVNITKSISDIRVDIEDPKYNSHLIQIKAGTKVPMHTHEGEEITVVLKGNFKDDFGSYKPGDFIIRNGMHKHTPYAETDCICFAITDAPLHYTGLFGPVINWFNARFENKYYNHQLS